MKTLSDKCRLLLIDMSLITESESVSGPLAKSCLQVCGHHYYIIGAVLNQNTDNPSHKKAKICKIGNGNKTRGIVTLLPELKQLNWMTLVSYSWEATLSKCSRAVKARLGMTHLVLFPANLPFLLDGRHPHPESPQLVEDTRMVYMASPSIHRKPTCFDDYYPIIDSTGGLVLLGGLPNREWLSTPVSTSQYCMASSTPSALLHSQQEDCT